MSTWDDLLAVTHPGREVEIPTTGERWLVLRRSYRQDDDALDRMPDTLTLTVEMVRADSPSDPRRPPADAPRPTTREDH